jgi:hypothetical protein
MLSEEFDYTKGVIRICKSTKEKNIEQQESHKKNSDEPEIMKYYDPILFIRLHNMNMINTEKMDLNIVNRPILDIRDQHWYF